MDVLAEVQAIANEYRREPDRRVRMANLRMSADWRNIGALKRELIEMWIGERNAFAESVVKDLRRSGKL